MGSWTGKYDPIRLIGDKVKKATGFDPSLASNLHRKIADKAHSAADTYLNQEPEGPGVKKSQGTGAGRADYSGAVSKARLRADNARKLTIMRSI